MALTDSNIHYWKFDGDADDAIGANDGTPDGASNIAGGIIGNCYTFDGGNDKIPTDDTSISNGVSTGITVNVWIKTGNDDGNTRGICAKNDGAIDTLQLYKSGGNLRCNWTTATDREVVVVQDFSALADDDWHMITAVYDGVTIDIYVDGFYVNGGAVTGDMKTFTEELMFGTLGGAGSYWDGEIDEASYWERDLSAAEVEELWNSGSGLQHPYSAGPDFTKLQINIGDVWKDGAGMQINIGDAWKEVDGAQINIGDAWKEIF